MEFLDLKYLFFSGIGGYPPPPLTETHPAQKPLAERGGTPPPRTEKTAKEFLKGSLVCIHFANTIQARKRYPHTLQAKSQFFFLANLPILDQQFA